MLSRKVYKVNQLHLAYVTVMIDRKKTKLMFDVRDLRKYNKDVVLYWQVSEDYEGIKGENELKYEANKKVKTLMKDNMTWRKEGGYQWVKEQEVKVVAVVEQTKIVAKEPVPVIDDDAYSDFGDAKEDRGQVILEKKESKVMSKEEEVEDNFFDESDPGAKVIVEPKKEEPRKAADKGYNQKHEKAATKVQRVVRGMLGRKNLPEKIRFVDMDYFGETGNRYLITAVRSGDSDVRVDCLNVISNKEYKALKGIVVPLSEYHINYIEINAEKQELEFKPETNPEEAPQEIRNQELNNSTVSNSSLVSRKIVILEDTDYTLSAHKYPVEKKIVLRLLKRGVSEPVDQSEINLPEETQEEDIRAMASIQLKGAKVDYDQNKNPKIILEDKQDMDSLLLEDGGIIDKISEAVQVIILPKGKVLYTKHVDEVYMWRIIPEEDKLTLFLDKKEEGKTNWVDFVGLDIPVGQKKTNEEWEEILKNYEVTPEGLIHDLSPENEEIQEEETPRIGAEEEDHGFGDQGDDEEKVDNFFADMVDEKSKYEIIAERLTGEQRDKVEVVLILSKDKSMVDLVEITIPYDEDAEPGQNEENVKLEPFNWTFDEKTLKLRKKEGMF